MSLVPLAPFLNSLGNDGFARPRPTIHAIRPQQFLYFFPLPHGHGSLRPTFGNSRRNDGNSICGSPEDDAVTVPVGGRSIFTTMFFPGADGLSGCSKCCGSAARTCSNA